MMEDAAAGKRLSPGLGPLRHFVEAGPRLLAVQEAVQRARGFPRALLAFAAGGLSVLSMAPFFLSPVLFFTLPVLLWLIDGATVLGAFAAGWWFAFGYFLAGLYWVGAAFLVEADKFAWALPFAVTLLPAGLALFWGAAMAAARVFWADGPARLLVFALALAGAEWLRGHLFTGFPWNLLGYALTAPLLLMQGASLLGVYGLTLWTALIGVSPLAILAGPRLSWRTRVGLIATMTLAPLVLLSAWGVWRLKTAPTGVVPGPRLRIVQPAIPQTEKWRPEKQAEIFASHLALSRRNPAGFQDDLAGITHVIWAEAAMPFLPLEHPEALAAIAALLPKGAFLIAGGLRREKDSATGQEHVFNSLMVFDGEGGLEAVYDKVHLVPFGEYLPFQETLESLGFEQLARQRGGFAAGRGPRPVLNVPGLPPFLGLICYEAVFPSALGDSGRPQLLVNLTNDGWFGRTTGPYQHFHQARVRAVEEGLPLVRVANNGISAVIDSRGQVLASLDLDQRGVIDTPTEFSDTAPLFAQLRELVFALNTSLFGILALGLRKFKSLG